jgi:hypothetical protein
MIRAARPLGMLPRFTEVTFSYGYSYCSASIGSTFVACQAGTKLAASVASTWIAATIENGRGLTGLYTNKGRSQRISALDERTPSDTDTPQTIPFRALCRTMFK